MLQFKINKVKTPQETQNPNVEQSNKDISKNDILEFKGQIPDPKWPNKESCSAYDLTFYMMKCIHLLFG